MLDRVGQRSAQHNGDSDEEKGQKSRSGGTKGIRFEGGQTPLYRRLPKRGFKNYPFRQVYTVINLDRLNKYEGEVNKEVLGVVGLLKVLGRGDISKALTVKADKFSGSARKKIEAAGGKCLT